MFRKTVVEIDLNSIKNNILNLKKNLKDKTKILIPVKADAYGHGIKEVSKYIEEENLADMLGVASIDEGIELRESGINLPVLILGLIIPEKKQIENIIKYRLILTLADSETAIKTSKIATELKSTITLHLKVDTGMGRIGCNSSETINIVETIISCENLILQGIYSHFPAADSESKDFTLKQIDIFLNIINQIEEKDIDIPLKHISNSAGLINFPEANFNMVRPGIISYGYLPDPHIQIPFKIIPSMTLKSIIIFTKKVHRGTPLSYGLTYVTDKDCNIATIPVGYGDGYNRLLSNKGRVIIDNKIYPVIGKVSMDQILVNLGDDIYPIGEEVILFGKEKITANEIAEWIDTIPYEVTCSISKRVPKIYI